MSTWTNLSGGTGEDNMGGVYYARFAQCAWLTRLPPPVKEGRVEEEPTFDSGKAWLTFTPTEETSSWKEEMRAVKGVDQWTVDVKLFVPNDSPEYRAQLEEMVHTPMVWEVYDNNGVLRRLGDLRGQAKMAYEFTTANQVTGQRGYTVSLTWVDGRPAPMVIITEDVITEDPEGGGRG